MERMSTGRFEARKLRSLSVAFVAVFALAGGLAACGDDDDDGGGSGDTEAKTIYLNAYAQEIPYFQDWQAGATAKAEELGWDVSGEFGNVTPEQQVQQVENALVQQPDAIVVTPIDEESLNPVASAGQGTRTSPSSPSARRSPNPEALTSFVGRDNLQIGRDKAQYVVDGLGGKGQVGNHPRNPRPDLQRGDGQGLRGGSLCRARHRNRRRPLRGRLLGRPRARCDGEHAHQRTPISTRSSTTTMTSRWVGPRRSRTPDSTSMTSSSSGPMAARSRSTRSRRNDRLHGQLRLPRGFQRDRHPEHLLRGWRGR